MNRTRTTASLAAAAALTIAVATAAAAAPVDLRDQNHEIITDNTIWTTGAWYNWGFVINDATIFADTVDPDAPWAGEVRNSDAFDGALEVFVQADETSTPVRFGDPGPTDPYMVDITDDGDTIVQAPTEEMAGLDVSVEQRFYAAGDLARVLATYANPTEAPITVVTGTSSNYGSDSNTTLEADSSGNDDVTADDHWIVTGDAGFYDPVVTTAWSTADAARLPGLAALGQPQLDVADESVAAFELTVDPGETVHLAYFVQLHGWLDDQVGPTSSPFVVGEGAEIAPAATIDDSYATAVATATAAAAEFDTFDGRLAAGLDVGAVVLNWGTVGGADTPEDPADPAEPVVADPTFTG